MSPLELRTPFNSPQRPKLSTRLSRKRTRDDMDDDEDTQPLQPIVPNGPESAMEYGQGMTLIDTSTGRAIGAESQTGTWYEENLELERQEALRAAESLAKSSEESSARPPKCQRLTSPTCPSLCSSAPSTGSSEQARPFDENRPDEVAQLLGVGWSSISKEDRTQQAAQGWAKYIQNHYPSLHDVTVLCESKSHSAYLASAADSAHDAPGFFLFTEDLNQGQLVARTWEACIQNLRVEPIVCEGRVLQAERSPSPLQSSSPSTSEALTNRTADSSYFMDVD